MIGLALGIVLSIMFLGYVDHTTGGMICDAFDVYNEICKARKNRRN